MDSTYKHELFEQNIYKLWESSGCFNPDTQKNLNPQKTPFSIILPPPNANNPIHAGNALFVVEDILIRYKKLLGHPVLWIPGTDHAGLETQFVYEKELQSQGKSRFDFDRDTLFKQVRDFVEKNKTIVISQLKRLGFALDWSRLRYTMDESHTQRIYSVFQKLHQDGLVYRDQKVVNYSTGLGTVLSNLEVDYKTVNGQLYYLNYGPLTVATTRPETLLGDTAVAVNPNDERYAKLIGTTLTLPLVNREIPIIADPEIDPKFGTGAVKVTPSHSPVDYEIALRHQLPFITILGYDGKSNDQVPLEFQGLFSKQLREKVVAKLQEKNLIIKIEPHTHEVGYCFKTGYPIEPLAIPQWFIQVGPLAKAALKSLAKEKPKVFPERFLKTLTEWLTNIKDWPISRQNIWGHRIPVFYNLDQNPNLQINFLDKSGKPISGIASVLLKSYPISEIQSGLQSLFAPVDVKYSLSESEAKNISFNVLQETDTFDTWFSSGQWPYSTLGWEANGQHHPDFLRFYPTSLLDTMWDIIFFWVARMLMFGLYTTGKIPFEIVHLHSRVVDKLGRKMSKSKGNVIEPIKVCDQYGADALRLALVLGISPASDIPLSDDKIRSERNFVNKLWNASRFVQLFIQKHGLPQNLSTVSSIMEDQEILAKLQKITQNTTQYLDVYNFGQASLDLYHFFWNDFCNQYLESCKNRGQDCIPTLLTILKNSLILLHPFTPFVTEAIYQELKNTLNLPWQDLLYNETWPNIQS